MGKLQFLQSHHMQYLDRCPHVPAAVASQKAVIFRNVQDIGHFHSRWASRCSLLSVCVYMHVCVCVLRHRYMCAHTSHACTGHTHVDALTCTRVSWQAWASGEGRC